MQPILRKATAHDINALVEIETLAFSSDRLSRRSFQRWVNAEHGVLLVAEMEGRVVGYGLVWWHRGTRLARLYSLAVLAECRGTGIAKPLIQALEQQAVENGRFFMRLEVAKQNAPAIALYQRCGYKVFGEYSDYYEDHSDALRMQKMIMPGPENESTRSTPWYPQTTEFSCGPAALMMAMTSLDATSPLNQILELEIWREATTIFMTSGHGGCHPIGLALAARKRGFVANVFLNTDQPLFVNGVRSSHKKEILSVVHKDFCTKAKERGVAINYLDFSQDQVAECLNTGFAVLMLISTYRLDGKKVPHWVVVTNIDERCMYVHDPDPDEKTQRAFDCQYMPIALEDFNKMSAYGTGRLRAAVAIRNEGQDIKSTIHE